MNLEQLSQAATIVGAFAIIGVAIQVFFAYKQLKADHERSRRERAVELLKEWSTSLKAEQTWARKLVEELTSEQCRDLWNQNPFTVSRKFKSHLTQFFEIKKKQESNGNITLTERQVVTLRWYVVSYLNMLESIFVAWQYSIVDREIIEHQFAFLFAPEKGHTALSAFRVASGGENTYPATEIFANHIETKRKEILKEKANVA